MREPAPDGAKPRGIPYSLDEAKAVAASHAMDPYHRELMQWLIEEAERLEAIENAGEDLRFS